jgi:hypothetical protein
MKTAVLVAEDSFELLLNPEDVLEKVVGGTLLTDHVGCVPCNPGSPTETWQPYQCLTPTCPDVPIAAAGDVLDMHHNS